MKITHAMKGFSQTSQLLILGLATVVLSGCGAETLNLAPDAQTTPVPTPTDTAAVPITPASPGQDEGAIANLQPIRCDTATYYSEVLWDGDQPRMTLTQKPVAANGYQETINLNKAQASRTVNPDNSTTFGSTIEGGIIYTRVFPNGSCFIQSVGNNSVVVFEENGRVRGMTPPPSPAVLPPTQASDYDRGYQDGRADARAGRTYDPFRGSRGLSDRAAREYTRGYADGYRSGESGSARPPVVDPTGPVSPSSPRPPVVDPTGPVSPGQPKPPVTDPARPITPPALTRPAIPGQPNSPARTPPGLTRPITPVPPSP